MRRAQQGKKRLVFKPLCSIGNVFEIDLNESSRKNGNIANNCRVFVGILLPMSYL